MSLRVNILAVLIVLGTSVPNVPIDVSAFEAEGDGESSDVLLPLIEIYPSAVTVVAGKSFDFKLLGGENLKPDDVVWGIREVKEGVFRGHFQAPDKPGIYHVTATYRAFTASDSIMDPVETAGCFGSSRPAVHSASPDPDAREAGHSEATVTVVAATFEIVPAWASAGTETTLYFDTTSNLGTNEDVRWERVDESVGHLHVSGLVESPKIASYTTPSEPGTYHLRAYRIDRAGLEANVAITVSTDYPAP